MKYMRQIAIILGVTFLGEVLRYYIPLPIPASVYGLCLMLLFLITGVIKVEQVKEVGTFLIEIMPLMFIPAAIGLMTIWEQLRPVLLPVTVIMVVTTVIVLVSSGKVADWMIKIGGTCDESANSQLHDDRRCN